MSWEQLREITWQNAQDQAYWDAQPPRSCPVDGTPLVANPASGSEALRCTFDGWEYPRDWVKGLPSG